MRQDNNIHDVNKHGGDPDNNIHDDSVDSRGGKVGFLGFWFYLVF